MRARRGSVGPTPRRSWALLPLLAGLLWVGPARVAAQTVVVTLDLTGSGAGTVTSSPAGLSCSGSAQTCTGTFALNTAVTLTATPSAGHTFGGWSGACQGAGPCTVFVTATGFLVAATFHGAPAYVFYHQDVIGSVRAVTNEAGAEVARYDYEPFGEAQATPGGPIRFGGKELDEETQFYYFGARFQRNILGRFTTDDPAMNTGTAVLEPQRWNRYAYALNNPLKYVDPDGKDPLLILGAIGGVVYGGWQVVQNLQHGNAWYENVGIEATKGALVGLTMGLAAPALAGASAEAIGTTAATAAAAGQVAVRTTERWAGAATGGSGALRLTETVARHAQDIVTKGEFKGELARPFLVNFQLLAREIMAAGRGLPDPGRAAGALRWDVPGTFRGTEGTWQLVVQDDLILHFNFVAP